MSLPLRTSLTLVLPLLACVVPLLSVSCAEQGRCTLNDENCDEVPDDIGVPIFGTSGQWVQADTDMDGKNDDGYAIDEDGDGVADGVAIDVNGDGYYDGIDYNGDGVADRITGQVPAGSGGAPGAGGTGSGGAPTGTGGTQSTTGSCLTATPVHSPGGVSMGQYSQVDTWRRNCADCPVVQYKFIANGWGMNWQGHALAYAGTTLEVQSYTGTQGSDYSPVGFPTVFCGLYSNIQSADCGLPATIASIGELDTGMRWSAGTQGTDYNVSYDIWMGNGNNFSAFLMLWLHDPASDQPVGQVVANNVYVADDPARWDVWTGTHQGSPIVSYVRPPGEDSMSYTFDVLDYIEHAKANYNLPGDTVLSVAGGFEIWNGPVSGLKIEDFCVDVR